MSSQVKFSTGLREGLAVTGALKDLMDGCSIKIYSGPVPASADSAIAGGNTLLVEVLQQTTGDPLNFESTATGGILVKATAETWSSTIAASGDASFFRVVKGSDTGAASTSELRIQGECGLAGVAMPLGSVSLVSGSPFPLNYCNIALPE
jgi:hypothetical protein